MAFTVELLSRGKGVPAEAQQAMGRLRSRVEADRMRGISVRVVESRIGLEGETRACVVYRNATDGRNAYQQATEMFKGVDLVNLKLERCDRELRQ